jgi:repressor of nif and glnA expression
MKNIDRICQLIIQCMGTRDQRRGITLQDIQDFFQRRGETTSLRGLSMALEQLDDHGYVQRLNTRGYGLTAQGKRFAH